MAVARSKSIAVSTMRRQEGRSVARRMQSEDQGWAVWDRSRLFQARTDEVGLLDGANQQVGDQVIED